MSLGSVAVGTGVRCEQTNQNSSGSASQSIPRSRRSKGRNPFTILKTWSFASESGLESKRLVGAHLRIVQAQILSYSPAILNSVDRLSTQLPLARRDYRSRSSTDQAFSTDEPRSQPSFIASAATRSFRAINSTVGPIFLCTGNCSFHHRGCNFEQGRTGEILRRRWRTLTYIKIKTIASLSLHEVAFQNGRTPL